MPKLAELRSAAEVRGDALRDPAVRAEYERTAFAHAVALSLIHI